MVALLTLPYHFATFVSYKGHRIPRKIVVQSSIWAPTPSSRPAMRKNYLRRKILRTPTRPHNVPLDDSIVVPIEPIEKLDSSFVEESEVTEQMEVVRDIEERNLVGFDGFSGRTVVRVLGSFVGLFILQTVVSVWMMGSGKSDGKDEDLAVGDRRRDLRLEMRGEKVGINGNDFTRNCPGMEVADLEMEAKIIEIRKMASEVREAEKRKKVENDEAELDNVSDDEEDDENVDSETDSSRFNSGILKEVDGRLSRLRKSYSSPLLKVNRIYKSRDIGEEGKDKSLDGKEDDNMLMFKVKPKFRSDLTLPKDKPKGFQSMDGVKKKQTAVNGDESVKRTGSGGVVDQKMSILDSTFDEKSNSVIDKEKRTPASQSSPQLKGSRQSSGRNSAEKRLEKGINGSSSLESNGTAGKSIKTMTKDAKLDSSNRNIVDGGAGVKKSSTIEPQDKRKAENVDPNTSESPATPRRKAQLKNLNLDRDAHENGVPWWSRLPYVLIILMQKGYGSEAQRGFYNFRICNDAETQSYCSYTVAFEDQNDAKNLCYLLESEFEDEPDAAVEVAPLSTKDFKEVIESLGSEVIVLRKGELKLYAGQPLTDVEDALRSLVK